MVTLAHQPSTQRLMQENHQKDPGQTGAKNREFQTTHTHKIKKKKFKKLEKLPPKALK